MKKKERFSYLVCGMGGKILFPREGEGGAGTGEGSGEGEGESSLTEDRVKEIVASATNDVVNRAMSNLRKKEIPQIVKSSLDPVTAQLSTITETLNALGKGGNGGGNGSGGEGDGSGKKSSDPETNRKLEELTRNLTEQKTQIEALTKAKEDAETRAEKTDRESKVRSMMSDFEFVSESAQQTAFNLMIPLIRREEETGILVAGPEDNPLPADAFIKREITENHPYLVKAPSGGGSGSRGGSKSFSNGSGATLEMIKPGMSEETREAVLRGLRDAAATIS